MPMITVVSRVLLVFWMLVATLFAFGSLMGHPGPFVLVAFALGALPWWRRIRRSGATGMFAAVVVLAALPPVGLLLSYGAGEGGISGLRSTVLATLVLGALASMFGLLGLALGRVVWAPTPDAETSSPLPPGPLP